MADKVPSAVACATKCEAKGYVLAALGGGGDQCVCADRLEAGHQPLPVARCALRCETGGDSMPCGGAGTTEKHLSLYRVAKLWLCEAKEADGAGRRGEYTFPLAGKLDGPLNQVEDEASLAATCTGAPACTGYCHNKDDASYTFSATLPSAGAAGLTPVVAAPMELRNVESLPNAGGEKWLCKIRSGSQGTTAKKDPAFPSFRSQQQLQQAEPRFPAPVTASEAASVAAATAADAAGVKVPSAEEAAAAVASAQASASDRSTEAMRGLAGGAPLADAAGSAPRDELDLAIEAQARKSLASEKRAKAHRR